MAGPLLVRSDGLGTRAVGRLIYNARSWKALCRSWSFHILLDFSFGTLFSLLSPPFFVEQVLPPFLFNVSSFSFKKKKNFSLFGNGSSFFPPLLPALCGVCLPFIFVFVFCFYL